MSHPNANLKIPYELEHVEESIRRWRASACLEGPFTPDGNGGNDGKVRDVHGHVVADCNGYEARADVIAAALTLIAFAPTDRVASSVLLPSGDETDEAEFRKYAWALEQEATDYAYAVQESDMRGAALIAKLASALSHYLERYELAAAPDGQRIVEIRARCSAADEGDWIAAAGGVHVIGQRDTVATVYGGSVQRRAANAEFIAHAREDIPYLLALLAARGPLSGSEDTNG